MNPPQVLSSFEDNHGPLSWPRRHEPVLVSGNSSTDESLHQYRCCEDLLQCELLECDTFFKKPRNKEAESSESCPDNLLSSTFAREDSLKPLVPRKVEPAPFKVESSRASVSSHQGSKLGKAKKSAPRRETFPGANPSVKSLGTSYKLNNWDVLCGRGRGNFEHIGNKRLRVLVTCYLKQYAQAKSRQEKSHVIDMIVEQVLDAVQASGGSGFVRKGENGEWFEVSKSLAREKVGHQLRDIARMQQLKGSKPAAAYTKRRCASI